MDKVVTIRQPWASLINIGEKRKETRSWKTNYRGPLYIHAGKSIEKEYLKDNLFTDKFKKHGIDYNKLPLGCIIAKCNLVDCLKVIEYGYTYAILEDGTKVEGDEFYYGDYSEGRYIWILDNIEQLEEYIPCKGNLSLWSFDVNGYLKENVKR